MVYTVNIDENSVRGRQLIKELCSEKEVATIENPALTGQIPEGYMTLEKFREHSTTMIKKMFANYE